MQVEQLDIVEQEHETEELLDRDRAGDGLYRGGGGRDWNGPGWDRGGGGRDWDGPG